MIDLDARDKIIVAASKLFAEKGFEGTSTRDIVNEAGVNLSLISYYFGGKEALYKVVLNEAMQGFHQGLQKILIEFNNDEMTAQSFETAIMALIDSFFAMRAKNPYIFIVYARENLSGMKYTFEFTQEILKEISEGMQTFVKKAQRKGIIHPDLESHYFLGSLIDVITGYFMKYDCCQLMVKEVINLSESKNEFKKQISLIFLKGIFK